MTALVSILVLFRRRTPQHDVLHWIIALQLVLVESVARVFDAPNAPMLPVVHLIALEASLGAGAVLLFAGRVRRVKRRTAVRGSILYAVGPALMLAAFAMGISSTRPYEIAVLIGIACSMISWNLLKLTHSEGIVKMLIWVPALFLVETRNFEQAAYWLLAYLFALIAAAFVTILPQESTGRLTMVCGFLVWSFSFFIHPWITVHPQWAGVAREIRNLQKFIVTIGMMMVLFERQIEENRVMALHDRLTGLPNTRLFDDRLETTLARCRRAGTRCAMYLIDLNHFKQVNDILGHNAGDELLQQVAHNLKLALRESDTVARIGGDEFLALATDLSNFHGAQSVQQTLRHALSTPVILMGKSFTITGSVGMAIFPDDADDGESLRNCADQRMYVEKQKTHRDNPMATQEALLRIRGGTAKTGPLRTA